MFARTVLSVALVAAVTAPSLPAPSFAATPLTLYPERIGAETARFYRGSATIQLKTPAGIVEVRPMPAEKGQVAFSLAVFNHSRSPANFGVENVSATVNGVPAAVPTYAQLADRAEQKARNAKIGTALFAGALAGVASTASNQGTYYRHVRGPRGGYTRAIHWEDNTPGVIGATAAVAGGAIAIRSIDQKLDYTLDRLGGQILQTTTVDPGASFGGMIVVPVDREAGYPARIRLQVSFNGALYPFAFQLAPAGMAAPPPMPATAQVDAAPQPPTPAPADR